MKPVNYHDFRRKSGAPEKSDESRQTSAKFIFPEIVQDHSGSVPGLGKHRKPFEQRDFGPEKSFFLDLGYVADDRAVSN